MEEDFFENLFNKKPTKTLAEYEEIVKKQGIMWRKSYQFFTPVAGLPNFDDFFKVAEHGDVKLCKFTVEKLIHKEKGQNVIALKFYYKKVDGTIIEGYQQEHPKALKFEGSFESRTFELADDEYPIKLVGAGEDFVLKNFGFVTNKGNELRYGGTSDKNKELCAPPGLYFTRFGSVHCTEGALSILCESSLIPEKGGVIEKKQQLDFNMLGMAIQNIFEFLSLKEIFTVFRLNHYFAAQKHLPAFLNRLAKRIIFSCNIQSREYIEEVMKGANTSIKSISLIADLLKITENKVKNPFGNQQFDGFQVTRKGGNGVQVRDSLTQNYRTSCFQTSYGAGEIQFKGFFKEYFDTEFMNQLLEGKAAIVAGCYMKNAGFLAKGYVQLIVRDDDQEKDIFTEKLSDDDLSNEWHQMFIKYQPDTESGGDSKLNPTSFKLLVGGQDKVYWAGFFGNLISGITFRGIPLTSRSDRQYFTV